MGVRVTFSSLASSLSLLSSPSKKKFLFEYFLKRVFKVNQYACDVVYENEPTLLIVVSTPYCKTDFPCMSFPLSLSHSLIRFRNSEGAFRKREEDNITYKTSIVVHRRIAGHILRASKADKIPCAAIGTASERTVQG